MLTLNLVSHELKQEIKLRHLYKIIKRIGYVFFSITLLISICLFTAKIILKKNLVAITEQTSLVKNTQSGYSTKVNKINFHINSIVNIQKDFNKWTIALENITDKSPRGIKIYFIKINKDTEVIKIGGKAAERENLMQFKDKLAELNFLANIDLPSETLLNKNDINFEINAKMNLPEISKLN